MDSVQGLISRIRAQCDARAVDIETELISYDRKQQGIISPVSLHRWILTLGLNFSTQQVQLLVNAFKKGEGVDWRALQLNIENIKSYSSTGGESSRPPVQCTAELIKMGQSLDVRRQTLREALKPYDTANRGKVSAQNLYRAFGCNDITKAIVKVYADTVTGFIDYLRLQNDIQNVVQVKEDPDSPITEVPDCFEILARYIKNRSIDLYALFKRVDSNQTGKLAENHFISAIASLQAPLSPVDIRDITQVFLDDETNLCNYKQFISSVEAFHPRPSQIVAEATLRSQSLAPKVNVPTLLEEIKRIVKQRRMNVRDHFVTLPGEGYESGVPSRIFGQILNAMHFSLDPDEIRGISQAFQSKTDPGLVDYNEFCNVISPQIASKTITSTDVVTRLKEYIAGHYTTFTASAERFDREGSGDISCEQLEAALHFIGFELTRQELVALYQEFPGKKQGNVAWMALAREVDPKTPLKTSRPIPEDTVTRKEPQMLAKPTKVINNILLIIQKANKQYPLDLEGAFARYDRRSRGFVNVQDFQDILSSFRLPINVGDIRLLTQFYNISGTPNIHSGDFIEGINSAEPIIEEVEGYLPPEEKPLPQLPPSVHNFIRRFKSYAQMRRITVADIFGPYDNQRNGTVQVYKIAAAFNNVQFPAMRAELEDLASAFRDTRKGELFNYYMFERAVKEEDIDNEKARAELTGAPISAEVNRDALTTCLQIREKLAQRRRRIGSIFAGVTADTMSAAEFQSRLESTGFVLRAGQLTALCRKYRVGLTDEIKWRDFCNDVEKSKTIGEF